MGQNWKVAVPSKRQRPETRTPARVLAGTATGRPGLLTELEAALAERWAYEYRTDALTVQSSGAGIAAYGDRLKLAGCGGSGNREGEPLRVILADEVAKQWAEAARKRAAAAYEALANHQDTGMRGVPWTPEIGKARAELTLAYLRGATKTPEEICEDHGCSPNTMRKRLADNIRVVANKYREFADKFCSTERKESLKVEKCE